MPGSKLHALAFADDVALVSSSAQGLQNNLKAFNDCLKLGGMKINHAKCATLSIIPAPAGVEPTLPSFNLEGLTIPVLGPADYYRYLGVDICHIAISSTTYASFNRPQPASCVYYSSVDNRLIKPSEKPVLELQHQRRPPEHPTEAPAIHFGQLACTRTPAN
ncbi:hypothetical protein HDE_12906 [Halotydeus destructor]|nr:hypothetical protein HDE_12906 [Halotydeus destructor]